MPRLRKISFLLLAILLCFIYFLLTKKYTISVILLIALVLSFILLRKLVMDELIIYWLYNHDREAEYDRIIKAFPKSGRKAIERLINRKIVKKIDNRIILIIKDYKFSLTKGRIQSK